MIWNNRKDYHIVLNNVPVTTWDLVEIPSRLSTYWNYGTAKVIKYSSGLLSAEIDANTPEVLPICHRLTDGQAVMFLPTQLMEEWVAQIPSGNKLITLSQVKYGQVKYCVDQLVSATKQ